MRPLSPTARFKADHPLERGCTRPSSTARPCRPLRGSSGQRWSRLQQGRVEHGPVAEETGVERPLNDPVLVTELEGLDAKDRAVLKETLATLMSDQVRRIE